MLIMATDGASSFHAEAFANHHEPVPHHDRLPELGALVDEGGLVT